MREVTLEEILNAREKRVIHQNEMIRQYNCPVISFSMNIAGPIKNSPLIRKAFNAGISVLESTLDTEGVTVLERSCRDDVTGCEAIYAVSAEAAFIKKLCIGIEEGSEIGRLFDLDVIGPDGVKLERTRERKCLICGVWGRGCASRRLHSVNELQLKTRKIIVSHFAAEESERISAMATDALRRELLTTPKPGLVDLNNNGSHADMDVSTFSASIEALRPYWKKCFLIGAETGKSAPEHTFRQLRKAGISAESDMLKATEGVNTHKGIIFLMGIVCAAMGRLYDPVTTCTDSGRIAEECAEMTRAAMDRELSETASFPEEAFTSGEKIWVRYGMKGARGEIAEGLPGVTETGLPMFQKLISQGLSYNDAGAGTLIALIARGTDTNMVKRGGIEAAEEAFALAKLMAEDGSYSDMSAVRKLDDNFIALNLSPGGCADLLALTYFLYEYCINTDKQEQTKINTEEDIND